MKTKFINIVNIFLGNLAITIAYGFVAVPNQVITGGVTGFSMVITKNLSISVENMTTIVTTILMLLCLVFLGKEYFMNSAISSLMYMTLLKLFLSTGYAVDFGYIINTIVAGVLLGLGYFFCIKSKASTAGFDVIALILNKHYPKIKTGNAIRVISIIIMVTGLFSYGIVSVLQGIFVTLIQTELLNRLIK